MVDAGTTRITVLGTEFSVHRTPQGIELMVLEGSVRLESGLGGDDEHVSLVLEAGAVARTGGDRSVLVERRGLDRLARDTSWREGQLYFDETRLADVAAEFNRYNHTHLVIADPDIAEEIAKLRAEREAAARAGLEPEKRSGDERITAFGARLDKKVAGDTVQLELTQQDEEHERIPFLR